MAAGPVVVDDGSADGTWRRSRACPRLSAPPACAGRGVRGAGPARNTGLAAAAVDIVLFLGDDTRPAQPDLLRRHVELHAALRAGAYAVLGRVGSAPELESRR